MAGKKMFWPVNFITSPAIGRCGKKLVLGPASNYCPPFEEAPDFYETNLPGAFWEEQCLGETTAFRIYSGTTLNWCAV